MHSSRVNSAWSLKFVLAWQTLPTIFCRQRVTLLFLSYFNCLKTPKFSLTRFWPAKWEPLSSIPHWDSHSGLFFRFEEQFSLTLRFKKGRMGKTRSGQRNNDPFTASESWRRHVFYALLKYEKPDSTSQMPHNTACETLTEPGNFQCPYKVVTCLKHCSSEPLCWENILVWLDTLHFWSVFMHMDVFQLFAISWGSVTHTIQCRESHLRCHMLHEMSFLGWQGGHWTGCGSLLVWAGVGNGGWSLLKMLCLLLPLFPAPEHPWDPALHGLLQRGSFLRLQLSRNCSSVGPFTAHSSSGADWSCFPHFLDRLDLKTLTSHLRMNSLCSP